MTDIDDQNARLLAGKGRRSGGAAIEFHDARVSKIAAWSLGVIGSLLVIAVAACAKNLWDLNLTMRDSLAFQRNTIMQLEDHERRLRGLERDVNVIEGRVFRGLDGYEDKEPARGH
jgi:hypothetical protein